MTGGRDLSPARKRAKLGAFDRCGSGQELHSGCAEQHCEVRRTIECRSIRAPEVRLRAEARETEVDFCPIELRRPRRARRPRVLVVRDRPQPEHALGAAIVGLELTPLERPAAARYPFASLE